jgi:light-regulated signal transduction histidine kinase (bacteriophytochrome)
MNGPAPSPLDLATCAAEPIRIPGGIQPHGALLVLHPETFTLLQVSANASLLLGMALTLDRAPPEILNSALAADLRTWCSSGEPLLLRTIRLPAGAFQLSAHRNSQGLILEFEAAPSDERETLEAVYPRLRAFVDAIGATKDVQDIANLAVRELRSLTRFNRVMIYSFDAEGDGTVFAEANDGNLPSYLDLRFPASDIPSQARDLYRINRLRLIPNADYTPAPIHPSSSPIDDQPLDLSSAALRSVSPIHLEYMRNMQTGASMSVSVLVDGALWGLISCHNREPKLVNAQIRSACDFLGQIVSLQIGARERSERAVRRIHLKHIEGELLARMNAAPNFHAGISASGDAWLRVLSADGVAVVTNEGITRLGITPSAPEIQQMAEWLRHRGDAEIFMTDSLSAHWSQAEAFSNVASGLLAAPISHIHASYIMWFRQEVIRTVRWGGDPRKEPGTDRLHPRKSFDIWKEQVRQKSIPWTSVELDGARDLRNSVIHFVLKRAEERAALSERLQQSNAELEAFSYSVSHDLRAPFRHIVGYAELLSHKEKNLDVKSRHYVKSIVDSALHAGHLVDDLLAFSQMGRASLQWVRVDMRKLVAEVRQERELDLQGRSIDWRIGDLPTTYGDPSLLRQVWANLIDNALKYSAGRDTAVIEVNGRAVEDAIEYSVVDNGVGFEMEYVGKLFGVFQRLHRTEHFAGTGIGLALVKRIIERHGGGVFARGEVDKGATIGFKLPKDKRLTTSADA